VLKEGLDTRRILAELLFVQNYYRGMWGHTWSLAVEEHFYLILPVLLATMLSMRRHSRDPFRPIVVVAALAGVALLGLRIRNAYFKTHYYYYICILPTRMRVDSLFFGAALSYAYNFHGERFRATFGPWRRWLIAGGCASLTPAFILRLESSPIIYSAGLTLFYLGSGAILIGVLLSKPPENGAAVVLGSIGMYSYSIYLWHLAVSEYGLPAVEKMISLKFGFAAWITVYLLASMLVGILMAKLVEMPSLRLRDRWFPARARPLQQS